MRKFLASAVAAVMSLSVMLSGFPASAESEAIQNTLPETAQTQSAELYSDTTEYTLTAAPPTVYTSYFLKKSSLDEASPILDYFETKGELMGMSNADQTEIKTLGLQLREGMKNHESPITAEATLDSVPGNIFDLVCEAAFEHTGDPKEGDYIAHQYDTIGGPFTYYYYNGKYHVTLQFEIKYFTTKEQEKKVDAEVERLLKTLDLNGKTDYEKVKVVYDYLCKNVVYDFEGLNNSSLLKHSVYAALISKKAVCQGYALALYRLLLELGIDCRYISGTAGGGGHAWNIIKLNGKYFLADSTWDATYYQAGLGYLYFLKCNSHFTDHSPDSAHNSTAFKSKYPIAADCFDPKKDNHAHSYVGVVTTPATCAATGVMTYTCSGCKASYTQTIAKTNTHSYKSTVTKAATCTEAGVRTYTCSVCKNTYTEAIAKTAHKYSDSWTIDTEAACTTAGSKSHHCTVCGDKKDVTAIPATGHSYTSAVTEEATCAKEGIRTFTCSACGDEYTETIAKLAHKYETAWTVDREPTCAEEGSKSHHCSVCGDKKDITAIAKTTEHDYIAKIIAPTPEEQGYTLHFCSVCGDSYTDTYTDYSEDMTVTNGTIKLVNATGIEGVTVIFANADNTLYEAQVSEDGSFSISALPDGVYTLTAGGGRFAPRSQSVTITDGEADADIEIALQLLGDLDGDGTVSIFDSLKVNKYVKRTGELAGYELSVADVDSSGTVNIFDCMKINSHVKKTAFLW